MDEYEQMLEEAGKADDSFYPSFLFNPIFNDFDDDYYHKSFAKDEIIAMAKKLRRRYNDFFEWANAMEIYNDYMDLLVDKYGGMRVIKNALKAETMPDPVPAKPKLKRSKTNKAFLQSGVIPTQKGDFNPSNEEILAIARQVFPDAMGEDLNVEDSYEKPPKALRKRIEKASRKMASANRKRNLYRSTGVSSGTDFIVEYLNQTKRGVYDSSGTYHKNSSESILEIAEEEEKIKNTPPELLDDELDNATAIVNGQLRRRKDAAKIEMYKELYSQDIDVIGNFGKNMNKKSVKMLRSQIGDTEPASKKELKKIKKRARKDRERIERRRDSNALLEQTLLGNKFNLSRDGDNLSFRLKDIYRD